MSPHSTLPMMVALTLFSVATIHAAQEVPPSGRDLGSVTGGEFKQAHLVIQKKCIVCHSEKVIEQAVAAGKDMQMIQERMERKGVKLSADERTVLGVFWHGTPLKKR